jgi:hypothetical protein
MRIASLLMLAALPLAACSDSTGPEPTAQEIPAGTYEVRMVFPQAAGAPAWATGEQVVRIQVTQAGASRRFEVVSGLSGPAAPGEVAAAENRGWPVGWDLKLLRWDNAQRRAVPGDWYAPRLAVNGLGVYCDRAEAGSDATGATYTASSCLAGK